MRNALKVVTWKIQEHSKNLKASTQNLQVWCTHSEFQNRNKSNAIIKEQIYTFIDISEPNSFLRI